MISKRIASAVSITLLLSFLTGLYITNEQTYQNELKTVVSSRQVAQTTSEKTINNLKKKMIAVEQQETHMKNLALAGRSVGLLNINPEPWNGCEITFYTGQAGINGTGTGITRSGKPVAQQWTAAVDPRYIPLGSIIEVQFADGTQQILQATDTGGMIRGFHVDVFDPNYADCVKRGGKQYGEVRILIRGR